MSFVEPVVDFNESDLDRPVHSSSANSLISSHKDTRDVAKIEYLFQVFSHPTADVSSQRSLRGESPVPVTPIGTKLRVSLTNVHRPVRNLSLIGGGESIAFD